MIKPIIGILPVQNKNESDDPYDDYFKFVDMYSQKTINSRGIPIGILMNNGNLNQDVIRLCDGFIIPGGSKIEKYVYELIYYCLINNKPVLGICMGAQAIAIFSVIYERLDKDKKYSADEIIKIYQELKIEYNGTLLKKLEENNIHSNVIDRSNVNEARHNIFINKNSLLYDVYNKNVLNVVSLHGYYFKKIGNDFVPTATADDNVIEAIEYKNKNYFILGVHYHPELDDNNLIFEKLIKESIKRKR